MESMLSGPRGHCAVSMALIGCKVLVELGQRDLRGVVPQMLWGVGTSCTNLAVVSQSRPMIMVLRSCILTAC
jgi:hypothetical protein